MARHWPPRKVFIHHTASPRTWDRADVRRVHVEQRGWSDVGYHWLLRYPRDGGPVELIPGRPESIPGAHVRGRNTGSIGVALIWHAGGPGEPGDPVPAALLEALAWHVAGICRRYELTADDVSGHHEAPYATACPGDLVDLDALRQRIRQLLPTTLRSPALFG